MAALAIAIRHAPFLWPGEEPVGFLNESYLAVDFFCLLSGFVIAHAYGDRLRGELSVVAFTATRFRRLYPLYALAVCLSLFSLLVGAYLGTAHLSEAIRNLAFAVFMLPSPFGSQYLYPLDAPAWSLFFELLANAVYALAVVRWPRAVLTGLVGASAAALIAAVASKVLGFGAADGPLNAGAYWSGLGAGALRVNFSFFAGVLLYKFFAAGLRLPTISAPRLCFILFCVLTIWVPEPLRMSYDLLVVFLLFPAIVLVGATSAAQGEWIARFKVFGGMSYALYVLQAPIYKLLVWAALATVGFDLSRVPILAGIIAVGLATSAAVLADTLFDRPIARIWESKRFEGILPDLPGSEDPASATASQTQQYVSKGQLDGAV